MCKFSVFGGLFASLIFLMFFGCFNMHFWSFSTFKNKHFVRDVFQFSKVVRVQSSSPFATVFVTDFGAKFGSFWSYVSMCWQCLFFRLLFIRFGTFFGAPNEPKKGLPILPEVLSLVFRASDGCPESFWTPPRGHFGRFGGPFFMILDDQDTISVNFGMHFSRVGRSND